MSFATENNNIEADYTEVNEQTKRRFLMALKAFGRRFWAYTEETGETDTKPFQGWQ